MLKILCFCYYSYYCCLQGVVARPQVIMTSLFFSLYKATKFYWGRHMMAQNAEKAIRFSGQPLHASKLLYNQCPIDACINNGNVFLNIDGEENRGYRNLPRCDNIVSVVTGVYMSLLGLVVLLLT